VVQTITQRRIQILSNHSRVLTIISESRTMALTMIKQNSSHQG
jgi:hypothetical protein